MGEILFEDDVVFENEYFEILQDWEVPIEAFFIIKPQRKLNSFMDFTDDESIVFMNLLRKLRCGMKEVLNINYVYFFQNEDSEHSFHLWVFPRYEWMMDVAGVRIQSVKPIMNYAENNLADAETIKKVKEVVVKMKNYMNDVLREEL